MSGAVARSNDTAPMSRRWAEACSRSRSRTVSRDAMPVRNAVRSRPPLAASPSAAVYGRPKIARWL